MDFISNIFAYPFRWIFNLMGHDYLLTLFIFALLMKLILFPFGIKQQKNSLKQAKLRPREMAIRNKYKGRNDKATQQKLNEEIMKLYQEENFNPMSGCFPMLLQLPILFALYGVITKPLTYVLQMDKDVVSKIMKALKSTSEIGAINQINTGKVVEGLSKADVDSIKALSDSFSYGSFDLSIMPQSDLWSIYILIPILTFVFSFASTKLIRKFTFQPQTNQDASTKASMNIMDFMMPLLSVYISVIMPSAIGIYWMFQNILSVVQQFALYKMYPIPAITEEEIKEAELQLKGKSKENKKKNVVLSDDYYDDYDKTEKTDKSGNYPKNEGVMSKRKKGISPKVLKMYKNGTRLRAKKKI